MPELLAGAFEVVERTIRVAADRGDTVGHTHLLRRLRALREPAGPRTKEQVEIDLALAVWTAMLFQGLLPDVLSDVSARLRECRSASQLAESADPWLALDPQRFDAAKRDVALEVGPLPAASIRACRFYERTRKPGHLREAVLILGSAAEIERKRLSPQLSAEVADAETRCLGTALSGTLPRSAFRFFATQSRAHIARLSAEPRARRRRSRWRAGVEPEQWLSLGEWTIAEHLEWPEQGEKWTAGSWFQPWLQSMYDSEMKKAQEFTRKKRERREAEKRRRVQNCRDEEARLKPTAGVENPSPPEDRSHETAVPTVAPRAPRETAATREVQADEFLNQELLRRREERTLRSQREEEERRAAREMRELRDAERLQQEAVKRRRLEQFEAKMQAKRSPIRIRSSPPDPTYDAGR